MGLSSEEPRRYLIAIGCPECSAMDDYRKLPKVETDVQQVVRLFEKQGYSRVLTDRIGRTASSIDIKKAISQWFADCDRQPSDHIVIYWAGHGDEGTRLKDHYLFTFTSDKDQIDSTSVRTEDLLRCFLGGSKHQSPANILLILDVCYAGAGARKIGAVLRDLEGEISQGSGISIISSADSTTEAGDGAFVEALTAVMENSENFFENIGEFISIGALVGAVNKYFKPRTAQQAIKSDAEGRNEETFLRNPYYLASRFPKQYQLLPIVNQLDWSILRSAYEKCLPETSTFPTNAEQMFLNLLKLPNAEVERFPEFLKALLVDNRISSETKKQIEGWADEHIADFLQIEEARSIIEYCLMIHVAIHPSDLGKYQIRAALIKDYSPESTNESDYLAENLSYSEKKFNQNEIMPEIVRLFEHCLDSKKIPEYEDIPTDQIKIQCFLPNGLLSLEIECSGIETGSGGQSIGTIYEVMVRSSQRGKRFTGNWRERWKSGNLEERCADKFIRTTDVHHFRDISKDARKVGCVLECSADDSGLNLDMVHAMINAGVPIAIWSRKGDTAKMLESCLDGCAKNLPNRLFEERVRLASPNTDELSPQIVLLWDNPFRPFPTDNWTGRSA